MTMASGSQDDQRDKQSREAQRWWETRGRDCQGGAALVRLSLRLHVIINILFRLSHNLQHSLCIVHRC